MSARTAGAAGDRAPRRLARVVLTRAVRGRRGRGGTWGEAVLGEFEATTGSWEAVMWMASGLRVAWREWRSRRWASVSAKGTRSSRLLATGWRLPVAIVTAGIVGTALLKWLAVGVTYVPSMSMEPTLRVSDRVVVNKAAYLWSGPQRGDVVLVDGTRIAGSGIRTDLLRRVIGLPGDLISCQDGYFYRDGAKIEQPHTTADTSLACTDTTVPQGRLYLVGDNLHVAVDSRKFGTVPREAVLGRVVTGLIWRGFGSG